MTEPMEVTESWRDKRYEFIYTQERIFRASDSLIKANEIPTIDNVKTAFSDVKGEATDLIENKKFTEIYDKQIKPELDKIEMVLFGNRSSEECLKAMSEYDVFVNYDPRTGNEEIININNIIKVLWDIHRITKQWAYYLGFLAKKPFAKKFGMQAIEEGLEI